MEPELLATETIVPVYFALEDDELLSIYKQTQISSSSQGSSSAAEGMEQNPNENSKDALHWIRAYSVAAFVIPARPYLTTCLLGVFFILVLLHTATANGFQMVTSGAQSKAVSDWAITSLEVSRLILELSVSGKWSLGMSNSFPLAPWSLAYTCCHSLSFCCSPFQNLSASPSNSFPTLPYWPSSKTEELCPSQFSCSVCL